LVHYFGKSTSLLLFFLSKRSIIILTTSFTFRVQRDSEGVEAEEEGGGGISQG
jgi:hypothetical protein